MNASERREAGKRRAELLAELVPTALADALHLVEGMDRARALFEPPASLIADAQLGEKVRAGGDKGAEVTNSRQKWSQARLAVHLRAKLAQGAARAEAIKALALEAGVSRRKVQRAARDAGL